MIELPSYLQNIIDIKDLFSNIETLLFILILPFINLFFNRKLVNKASQKLIDKFKKEEKYLEDLYVELGETKESLRYFVYGEKWKTRIINDFNNLYNDENGNFLKTHIKNKAISFKLNKIMSLNKIKKCIEKNKELYNQYPCNKELLINLDVGEKDNTHNCSLKKYQLEKILRKVVLATERLVLLKGSAGNGKTSILCNLVSLIIKLKNTCVFVNSRDLSNVEADLLEKLHLPIKIFPNFSLNLLNIKNIILRTNLFIVIDAINENDSSEFKNTLPKLLNNLLKFRTIKILISCRSEYFEERYNKIFIDSGISPFVYVMENYYLSSNINPRTVSLLYQTYKAHYNFKGKIGPNIFHYLMNSLLLMRIFFEYCKNKKDNFVNLNRYEIYKNFIHNLETKVPDICLYINRLISKMVEQENYDKICGSRLNLTSFQLNEFRKICDENLLMSRKIIKHKGFISEEADEDFYFVFDELRDYCIAKYLITNCQNENMKHYQLLFDTLTKMQQSHLSPFEGILTYSYAHFRAENNTILCMEIINKFLKERIFSINNNENKTFVNMGLNIIFNCNKELLDFEYIYILSVFKEYTGFGLANNDIFILFKFLVINELQHGCYSLDIFYNILMNYENIGALLVVSSKSLEVVDRKLLADNLDIFIQLILICYLSDDYHKKNFLYDLIKKYKNIEIILDNITKKSSCSILKQRCQNFIRELKKENV